MAKQENRLKQLLTTNLESKLAKGFPRFKRSVEKEIIKHDMNYGRYRNEREECRLSALKEIEEIRERHRDLLEEQLQEINEQFRSKKRELQEKNDAITDADLKEFRELQNKRYTVGNRLERFIEQDRSQYGVENLINLDHSDSDTESTKSIEEDDQKERTIQEIVAEHLALGEIPSNFKYSPRYRYPYDPKLNTSGKWDLWKQPWFIETFPKHLLEVVRETSREILKKTAREVFEDGYEEQEVNEEHSQKKKGIHFVVNGVEEG